MPYNNYISADDADALIPQEVSNEIIKNLPQKSATLQLARRLPNMSRTQVRTPVLSAMALAYFVNGATGLKQTAKLEWADKYIDAEEIACIVPIPQRVLDDADYDIWGEVRPAVEEAMGLAIDAAVLYGTNIPAAWTTDLGGAGIVAVANTASQVISLAAYTDLYEAILGEDAAGIKGLLMLIEEDGFMATGHIGHVTMRGKLRNCRDANGQPIFTRSMQDASRYELDGAPIQFPLNGAVDLSQSLLVAGQWDKLVYSMRQDISYTVDKSGVIQDASGNIIYNLFQQDMVALRAVMRLGFSLPNPINAMQETAASRCAFSVLTA